MRENLIPEFEDYEEDREKLDTELYYSKKEGKEEGIKETANNMLKKKFDIKDIIDITGLSESEIKELEEKSKNEDIEEKQVNLIPDFEDFATEEEDREMMRNTELYYSEKKGREEGVKENKIETARNMLKKKFDIKDIIDITGLSKSEIEKLKEA